MLLDHKNDDKYAPSYTVSTLAGNFKTHASNYTKAFDNNCHYYYLTLKGRNNIREQTKGKNSHEERMSDVHEVVAVSH